MNPANTPLRLLHVTDPHLHAHAESRMRGVVTYDTFRAVIKHATSSKLAADAILATGDLVQDETRTGYERFSEVLTPLQKPVLCIPGNHDAPNIMASTLAPPLFQVGGSWQRQGWSVILLSSFARGDDGGQLSTEELHRLENLLTEHADLHTLVCLHHHPVPMGSAWLDGVALRNADELMQIIDRAPQVRGIV
ncbi:MAG: metallophosphoesterase, partial [Gammaproteobacteria bacterium]|nr:metallophosphoesterase [Gammaproteobacteria bacterium]